MPDPTPALTLTDLPVVALGGLLLGAATLVTLPAVLAWKGAKRLWNIRRPSTTSTTFGNNTKGGSPTHSSKSPTETDS